MHANSFLVEKDRQQDTARDFSDWSRKGPLPELPQQRKSSGREFGTGGPRGMDNMSEAGSERGGRRPYEPSDGKVRDFGNWERKGPPTPTLSAGQPARSFDRPGSRDGPQMRRNSPAWGEGRSQDSGSRPPRREFVERPHIERAPTAAEQDTQWRTKMRPDPPPAPPTPDTAATRSPSLSNRELSNPASPAGSSPAPAKPAAPVERPRLNLLKRGESKVDADPAKTSAGDSKANPFGAARPTDTATREKEVEEKRQVALKEKKEADDKAKEEKKVADEKAKEEKRVARDAELAARANRAEQSPKSPQQANGDIKQLPERKNLERKSTAEKENGVASPAAGRQFEILRRQVNEENTAADEEVEELEAAEETGLITGDKEVKPQEIIRDPKTDTQTNGNAVTPAEPTAKELEDEGWSTISKPAKKKKNGNQAARAIAS